MSDGPQKMVPKAALPLDEIILGEDEAPAAPPAAALPAPSVTADGRSSVRPKAPEKDRASVRPRDEARAKSTPEAREVRDNGDGGPTATTGGSIAPGAKDERDSSSRERKRAKMTLRIPDDEVSRPTLPSVETPAAGIAALVGTPPPGTAVPRAGSVRPIAPTPVSPDDTIELPPEELRRRLDGALAEPPRALGVDPSHEPGWTPYQPPVAEGMRDPAKTIADDVVSPVQRVAAPVLDLVADVVEEAPASEDIPVDTDEPIDEPSNEVDDLAVTHPRLPTVLDSEEIRLDDGDRVTDPGAEEVSAEDLVSVESLPKPGRPPPPKPKPAAQPAVTATALMAGASQPQPTPTPNVVTPAPSPAPVVTAPAPAAAPAATAVAPAPSAYTPSGGVAAINAQSGGMAQRRPQSTPQVIVPPVGALAPPPMNEAAANRKKTRPWWEDLFNDDFIRTMAKLTDGQIAREVDFIEESLGCEAGAMILDLACGTGRHAVELATRGYQVVGFDLSLSMLARASDEAQDRKQKINFVQGDMREMTFEETFDGIYSWNTSFGFFDEEKNAACVAKVHRALKKGGQFLLDVVNRDYIIRQSPSLAWYEGDGCICMDEMQIDWITSRMKVKRTLMMDDGRTKEIEYSIRVYSLHELGKLLHDNGFRVAEVSGRTGTPGVFFGCEAPRTLILAEKR